MWNFSFVFWLNKWRAQLTNYRKVNKIIEVFGNTNRVN